MEPTCATRESLESGIAEYFPDKHTWDTAITQANALGYPPHSQSATWLAMH